MESQGVCILGDGTGNLAYFRTSTFPNPIVNYVRNESSSSSIAFENSFDEKSLLVFYGSFAVLRIYNLSDWTIIKTINLDRPTNYAIWSFDDRYLIVFPTNANYILVYDKSANWTLSRNVSIGYNNIGKCISRQ